MFAQVAFVDSYNYNRIYVTLFIFDLLVYLFNLDQVPGTTAGTEVLPRIVLIRREAPAVDDAGESHHRGQCERHQPAKTCRRGQ